MELKEISVLKENMVLEDILEHPQRYRWFYGILARIPRLSVSREFQDFLHIRFTHIPNYPHTNYSHPVLQQLASAIICDCNYLQLPHIIMYGKFSLTLCQKTLDNPGPI